MSSDCVSATKILMMGVKLMTERYKKRYMKSKGECKDKISVAKRIHIFSCTTMIAKQPYIEIFIDFLSINFNLLSTR